MESSIQRWKREYEKDTVRLVLKSELSAINRIDAIDILAVPVVMFQRHKLQNGRPEAIGSQNKKITGSRENALP